MPLVTVSDVLRFALPPGTALVAGASGSGAVVSWARLLRGRPTTLASVETGEVWILAAGALQQGGEPRVAARLVRDVASAGVVALVSAEPLPAEMARAADDVGMPLVRVPPEASLADAEKAIISLVVDRDRAIGERVQAVYERLLATLVEDRGPELLAGIVHEVTGKAVYLLDEHFQPSVHAGGSEQAADGLAQLRARFLAGEVEALPERPVPLRSSRRLRGWAWEWVNSS